MARKRTEQDARSGTPGDETARDGMMAWFGNQAVMLDRMNEMAARWLERRREAIDEAQRSLDELSRCKNWTDMLRVQQDWLLGAMRRLTSDVTEFAWGAGMTQETGSRFERASHAVASDLERVGNEAAELSAAGSKPKLRRRGSA